MKHFLLTFFILFLSFGFFGGVFATSHVGQSPSAGSAGGQPSGKLNLLGSVKGVGDAAGYNTAAGEDAIITIVAKIIRGFLGLAGIFLIVLYLYAGYTWMTAQGEEEQVSKAKRVILQATIGLAIILIAWAITSFVVKALVTATGE